MLNYILHNLDRYPLDGVVHFELEIDYPFIHNVIDYMETECKRAGIQFVRIKPRKTWEELYDKCGFPTRKVRWCNGHYKLDAKRQLSEWLNEVGFYKAEAELEKQEMQKALYESNLRTREKRVTSYDAILTNIRKAQQEKQMQSIEKEQSLRHREVFSGGHNAVRSKKQTDALLNEDVSKLSNADIEKVLTFIRTNAKTFRQKLRKLYITQQKKQIDVKKTIEKSVQCDGEIARLYYKKPIKSKANVVMLADISGSCRAMTSLALTYMGLMREVFPGGCHLFVFVNHLVPVDRYFSNENITSAVESINKSVPSRGIYSNYGVPLKELRYDNTGIINKDTTIVMLGDCRNNKNYSGVEEVEWLSKRASNFFVLNPDPLNKWGQGDSIADLYAKSGAVVSMVGSAKDLLTFLQSAGTTRHFWCACPNH
jgi:uncharacterized protein with von Willebrand factor type A (vWA) domain